MKVDVEEPVARENAPTDQTGIVGISDNEIRLVLLYDVGSPARQAAGDEARKSVLHVCTPR